MAKYKFVYIHVLKKSLFMCLLKDCESAKSWPCVAQCILYCYVIYCHLCRQYNVYVFAEKQKCSPKTLICGVIVIMLASSAVDRGFESRSGETKDYQLVFVAYNAKHAELRRKSKDRLARNQNNLSEWSDISTQWLLLAHLAKGNVSFYHHSVVFRSSITHFVPIR